MIALRLRAGRDRKHRAGGYAGFGSPRFGERVLEGRLVPDEGEAAVLTRVFQLRASGASLREVARVLDLEGHPTKRGGRWHVNTVARIVRRMELAA